MARSLLALSLLCPFLFLGVAAQAAGVYAFAIALPAFVLLRRRAIPATAVAPTAVLGACFLVAWAVFPLVNLLLAGADAPARVAGFYVREWPERVSKVLASRFSSAWLVSGVSLLVVAAVARGRGARSVAVDEAHAAVGPAYRMFLRVFLGCAIAWAAWLTIQHVTGFDPRAAGKILAPEHRMEGGLYRVFGFYGHPLSVAGTGLIVLAFFWFLGWSWVEGRSFVAGADESPGGGVAVPRLFPGKPPWVDALCYFGGAAVGLLAVVESGGRTALAAGVVILVVLPFSVRLKGRFGAVRLAGTAAVLCAALLVVATSDVGARIEGFVRRLGHGQVENRVHFWKTYATMIGDAPLLGHGSHWIETGLRDAYYGVLGFVKLEEKFNAHNIYLETLANVGVVGAGVLCAAVWYLLRTLSRLSRESLASEPRLLVRAIGACVMANLLHAATQNVFFDTNVLVPYLGLFWATYWLSVASLPFVEVPVTLREQ